MFTSNLCDINYKVNFLNYILKSGDAFICLRVVVSLSRLKTKICHVECHR